MGKEISTKKRRSDVSNDEYPSVCMTKSNVINFSP